jgi:hypothetical protein
MEGKERFNRKSGCGSLVSDTSTTHYRPVRSTATPLLVPAMVLFFPQAGATGSACQIPFLI